MKKILLALLLLVLLLPAHAQSHRPKVAVVLSGGGAKGVAHIKALKVIEEAGFPIDIITGTSMGSLIGGLYSIGWSTDELDSLVRSQDWPFLLSDQADPASLDLESRRIQNTYVLTHILSGSNGGGGFIRGINLDHLFDRLLYGYTDSINFNSLPVAFACVATDLITNTEVDFHDGYLKEAMRSSMSIPGVFAPVRKGKMVLVDGGLRNNYPVDLAIEMGADVVIGVSVQGEEMEPEEINHTLNVLQQIIDVNCKNKYDRNLLMSDIVMRVDVSGYSAASFTASAIDTLLRRGETEARSHWDELLALRRRLGIDSVARPQSFTHPAPRAEHQQRRAIVPETLDKPQVGVAFRFDSEELAAMQLMARFPFGGAVPSELRARVRFGQRFAARVEHMLFPHGFTSPTIGYTFYRNDLDFYVLGKRQWNVLYVRNRLDLMPINTLLKHFELKAGLSWDHYHYYELPLSTIGKLDLSTNDYFFRLWGQLSLNTEDNWHFPERGINFKATYAYTTDNLFTYDGEPGLMDVTSWWRFNVPLSRHLSLQPMVYGRLFFGHEVPLPYSTVLGAEWFGQYLDQQLPFDGVRKIEYTSRNFLAARLQLQLHLRKNHYIQARISAAATFVDFDQGEGFTDYDKFLGLSLGYAYNTLFGPIGITAAYSTLLDRPTFYLNIGHNF